VVMQVRAASPTVPIYLCRKAGSGLPAEVLRGDYRGSAEEGNICVAASRPAEGADRDTFEKRYRARAGRSPSLAAAQAYDAVRVIAAALRRSGPNRARLRDALAEFRGFAGVSGVISFDHAGNDVTEITLVRVGQIEGSRQ
jgi:branched-chain amino acid transport system substrate-binding protein